MQEWAEEEEPSEEAEKQLAERWQDNQREKVSEVQGDGNSWGGHPVPQRGHEIKTETRHWICRLGVGSGKRGQGSPGSLPSCDLAQTAAPFSKTSVGETKRDTEGNNEIKFININI